MSLLNGWLIYSKDHYNINTPFARRFLDSGNNSKSSIKLIFKDELYYGIESKSLCLKYRNKNVSELPDFVINRTIDPLLSRHLEAMGIKVFNSSQIAEICNDKGRTYLEVSKLDIPMVDTLFADKDSLVKSGLIFDYPVVVKTTGGRGGKEVMLASSDVELINIAEKLPGQRFVVQKLSGNPGRDVRVFVVGKEIVGSVLRLSQSGFRANLSLGGTVEPYKLNEQEKSIVMKIVNHFNFGMVGIDFIFDEKGRFLFNEIEDVAGSRTLSMTSKTDIVKLYLDYIFGCFGI